MPLSTLSSFLPVAGNCSDIHDGTPSGPVTLTAACAFAPARAIFRGAAVPVVALVGLFASPLRLVLGLALAGLSISRQAMNFRRSSAPLRLSMAATVALIVSKHSELHGLVLFYLRRLRRKPSTLIEYK